MTSLAPGRPSALVLLRRFAFVAALVALDLWSKSAVFAWLSGDGAELVRDLCGHRRQHVLGQDVGWFTFMLSENPGAAFGGFADSPHLLIGLRVVAVLGLLYLIVRTRTDTPWFTTALLLVLAGALGNLYDNLFREGVGGHPYGKVRDFIDVYFAHWDWHFPTFNVADSCITVGAAILLIGSLFRGQAADAEQESEGEPAAEGDAAPSAEGEQHAS